MIPTSCAAALRRTTASNSRTASIFGNTAQLGPGRTATRVVRRWNASKSPVGQKTPESAKSIPGPTWLWLEPVYEPFRAYGRVQRRRPYTTQFISALVIYFVGDLVAQSLGATLGAEQKAVDEEEVEERGWVQVWAEERDWARTARALTIGGLAAVPGYKWFLWLSNSFNYSSKVLSLTTKVSTPLHSLAFSVRSG